MTHKTFATLYGAALAEQDEERFIAEWSSSSLLIPDDPEIDVDFDAIASDLANIWDVAHMTIRDMIDRAEMTQTAFAERFCIPMRTVQNWAIGQRECPPYIRLMMADSFGWLTVQRA